MRKEVHRESSNEHTKALVLEIKLKRYIGERSKFQCQAARREQHRRSKQSHHPSIEMGSPINTLVVVDEIGQRMLSRVAELDQISSSLKLQGCNKENKKKSLKRTIKRPALPVDASAERRRREFYGLSEAILETDAELLEKFVTGGYLEQEGQERRELRHLQRTHQRFMSMERMYELVKQSDRFKKELVCQDDSFPQGSIASYLLQQQRNNLGKIVRAPTLNKQTRASIIRRQQKQTSPSMVRKRHRRHRRQCLSEINQGEDLLVSIELMKNNFRSRTRQVTNPA